MTQRNRWRRFMLLESEHRHVGDEVAAVAADSEQIAEEALT